jgi:hypothetical protein
MDLGVALPKNPRIGEIITISGNKTSAYMWNGTGWQTIRKPLVLDPTIIDDEGYGKMGLHKKISTDILNEIPKGDLNGSNTFFTLDHKPIVGTEKVYLNGLGQTRGQDYNIIDNVINYTYALEGGSRLLCSYATQIYTEITNEVPIGSVDGTNVQFTLFSSPVQDSECVYLNGMRLSSGNDKDYVIINNILQFNYAPWEKSNIKIDYNAIV